MGGRGYATRPIITNRHHQPDNCKPLRGTISQGAAFFVRRGGGLRGLVRHDLAFTAGQAVISRGDFRKRYEKQHDGSIPGGNMQNSEAR